MGDRLMSVNLREDIRPLSSINSNAIEIFNNVNERKNPIVFTQDGQPCGVLLDVESYQNMIDALSIFKLIQISENSIQNEKLVKSEQVFDDLRNEINVL